MHTTSEFKYDTDFLLWDTYRNLHSLITLVYPEDATNFAASLVQMGQDASALSRWPLAAAETRGMIGDSTAIVLAETQLKGFTGWDARAGYEIAKEQSTQPAAEGKFGRDYVNDWNTRGYIASDSTDSSVSRTLEYAADHNALSAYATSLSETADAGMLKARSKAWENLYAL